MKAEEAAARRRLIWERLHSAGLGELALAEQIRARRAALNASGGPLSVKKGSPDPVSRQLGETLVRLMLEHRGGDRAA